MFTLFLHSIVQWEETKNDLEGYLGVMRSLPANVLNKYFSGCFFSFPRKIRQLVKDCGFEAYWYFISGPSLAGWSKRTDIEGVKGVTLNF